VHHDKPTAMGARQKIIRDLERAMIIQGRVRDRGDVVAVKKAFEDLGKKLSGEERWRRFVYYWALREPSLIEEYVRNGHDLKPLVGIKATSSHLPGLCLQYFKPEKLIQNWENVTQQRYISDLVKKLTLFERGKDPPSGDEIMKSAKKIFGIGVYSTVNFFRILCLTLERPYPGDEFALMGDGADKAQFDYLKLHGFNNLTDIRRELDDSVQLDAGELSFYVCMADLYKSDKEANSEETYPRPEDTSFTTRRVPKAKKTKTKAKKSKNTPVSASARTRQNRNGGCAKTKKNKI
jgi:hypothetical protein